MYHIELEYVPSSTINIATSFRDNEYIDDDYNIMYYAVLDHVPSIRINVLVLLFVMMKISSR